MRSSRKVASWGILKRSGKPKVGEMFDVETGMIRRSWDRFSGSIESSLSASSLTYIEYAFESSGCLLPARRALMIRNFTALLLMDDATGGRCASATDISDISRHERT